MRPKDVGSRHLRVVFSFLAFRSRHLPRYASLFRIANCYFASSRYGRIRFPSIRSARRSRGDLSTRSSTKSGGYPFERILGVEYESNTSRIRVEQIRSVVSHREKKLDDPVCDTTNAYRVYVRFTNSCYRIYKKALGCRAVEQRDRVSPRGNLRKCVETIKES